MHSPAQAFRSAAPQPSQRANYLAGPWAYVIAGLLAVFYFLSSLYIAAHRVFWFDELFTIHIARLSNWTAIWTALSNGVDALPPPYYMLVRAVDSFFGPDSSGRFTIYGPKRTPTSVEFPRFREPATQIGAMHRWGRKVRQSGNLL